MWDWMDTHVLQVCVGMGGTLSGRRLLHKWCGAVPVYVRVSRTVSGVVVVCKGWAQEWLQLV